MNSLDRFSQAAAEDRQASLVLSYADARMLNQVDQAIAAIKRAQMEGPDSDNNNLLKDALTCLEGIQSNLEG